MKALWYDGRQLNLRTGLDVPRPKKGESLVCVKTAGICATDLEITRGYMGFTGIPGHEFAGIVTGPHSSPFFGKRVTGEINLPCRKCGYCKQGLTNHCPKRSVLGILKKNGAFAEYVTLPDKNLHELPGSVTDEEAVFIEPLAAAFEIMDQVSIKKAARACVLGDGRLGLLVSLALKLSGANIVTIGRHADKLKILRTNGIKTVLTDKTVNEKFDVVIDCTGSAVASAIALSLVKPKGTLVIKSTVAGARSLDLNKIVIDEITVIGSRCGPFKPAINAIKDRKIDVTPLIDSVYPLKDGIKAFKRAGQKGALKVIVHLHPC